MSNGGRPAAGLSSSSLDEAAETTVDAGLRRLHVVTECYPRPNGLHHCAFAHRQLVGVRDAGWDVEVLIPNGWFPPVAWRVARPWRAAKLASVPKSWMIDGIPVSDLRYRNPAPSRLSRQPLTDRIAEALQHHLGGRALGGRDVILVQFALPYGQAVRAAARGLGLPYVVQLRGDDVWVWPHRGEGWREEFVATVRDADLVVGVSGALLDEARRLAGHSLHASAVVPNGIELDRFRPVRSAAERATIRGSLGLADDELVVLCVGDLLHRKGWLELLEALEGLSTASGRLKLMAVAASSVDELDLLAEAARRAPRLAVQLARGVDRDRLADLYRAADVFCLPSHWEGLANALLEAMATGLACVTTAVAGHPEVVTTEVDGILIPPRDVAALGGALERLLGSATLREALGRNARSRAEGVGDSRRAGARLSMLLDGVRGDAFASSVARVDPYASREPTPASA
jgi:glycosyltransferase involved in cell wall biosynthesis